jgi:hypothetical protein
VPAKNASASFARSRRKRSGYPKPTNAQLVIGRCNLLGAFGSMNVTVSTASNREFSKPRDKDGATPPHLSRTVALGAAPRGPFDRKESGRMRSGRRPVLRNTGARRAAARRGQRRRCCWSRSRATASPESSSSVPTSRAASSSACSRAPWPLGAAAHVHAVVTIGDPRRSRRCSSPRASPDADPLEAGLDLFLRTPRRKGRG